MPLESIFRWWNLISAEVLYDHREIKVIQVSIDKASKEYLLSQSINTLENAYEEKHKDEQDRKRDLALIKQIKN